MEQHVKDEISKQLDYYVDAYRKVHDLDLAIARISEELGALSAERLEAEKLRDLASETVEALIKDIPEVDEPVVKSLVNDRLSSLVGLMVF